MVHKEGLHSKNNWQLILRLINFIAFGKLEVEQLIGWTFAILNFEIRSFIDIIQQYLDVKSKYNHVNKVIIVYSKFKFL